MIHLRVCLRSSLKQKTIIILFSIESACEFLKFTMAFDILRSLPFNPVTERHKIFATDMVYFLNKEYGSEWYPYGWKSYYIDPLSPWTSDMEEAAIYLLKEKGEDFKQKCITLQPRFAPGHIHFFWSHCRENLKSLFDNGCSPDELFETIIHIGRLSVEFYQTGIYNAPNCAILEIGEALKKYMCSYGPNIFSAFTKFTSSVIKVHSTR